MSGFEYSPVYFNVIYIICHISRRAVFLLLLLGGAAFLPNALGQTRQKLFSIERSLNEDQIVYFLHLDEKGLPLEDNPIQIKWLDNEKTGELVQINWIKKKFGYGIEILSQNEDQITFRFVSYDEKIFSLKKDNSGSYNVYGTINNCLMKIDHIYLEMEGGSFWKPNITKVTVHGIHELANTRLIATFNP